MSESITLDVGGMTCDGCSNRVKTALESIQGVDSANVSHESGVAIIEHQKVSFLVHFIPNRMILGHRISILDPIYSFREN